MESSNRLGDIEIKDPQAMRALAHPVRLAILDRLLRHGPATATELAPDVGATPSVTSWHLRHLAGFGLVRDSEPGPDRRRRRWEAAARGYRFETPQDEGDEEGRSAARLLSRQMFLRHGDLPSRWAAEVEPGLDPEWAGRAGLASTRVVVSADELAAIEDEIERVLAPYVTRDPAERPAGGRGVQLMRYALPEAADEQPEQSRWRSRTGPPGHRCGGTARSAGSGPATRSHSSATGSPNWPCP
ncbi:helix-turn-helix domain-containing protein [Streptomyces sp. NBC_01460]|uniref:ArsR/SmtB family transcription factor n=1 Tax=Streptomyces sp. NBC_01460 TaxID=2903875 RepID=UPI002E31B288|nr:helix-turn-helix domain-containing protein [Streptomyces sp. NBC_01460]